jgi:hypothetical protein
MPYTLLKVTERGVVLWDYHVRRLGLERECAAREAFIRFAREAAPGVWAVWSEASQSIRVEARSGSRLRDGMPVRFAPSPVLGASGPIPKPAPPSVYDGVRVAGTATLLTTSDGLEILEACSAAVVSWDGECLVCVPRDRPRVDSMAEAAIRDRLRICEAPIPASSNALLLVNAVVGTCALDEARSGAFPPEERLRIDEMLAAVTWRP